MPGTSIQNDAETRAAADRAALWKRVGAFVRARREALALSQGDMIGLLGYKSRNAISNVELGLEGIAVRRAYAWAEILGVPRDEFFLFVTGQSQPPSPTKGVGAKSRAKPLSAAEEELLAAYRRLPPKFQRRLRETARELETLARAAKHSR